MNTEDNKLSALLRGARPTASLPPRFQQNVWRRIEDAAAPESPATWLDALVALILRPRFAYAMAIGLLVAGSFLGVHAGKQAARHEAMTRYVASVAPESLR